MIPDYASLNENQDNAANIEFIDELEDKVVNEELFNSNKEMVEDSIQISNLDINFEPNLSIKDAESIISDSIKLALKECFNGTIENVRELSDKDNFF